MARSAYELYQNALKGQNYYGSSGYWADSNDGNSRTGYGYPGDRSKNSIAARYGLTPSSIGTSVDSWGTSDSLSRPTIAADGLAYVGGSTSKFTGTDPVTKKHYVNGAEQVLVPGSSDQYINPNDPNQRYQAVSIAKNPALNAITDTETGQLAKDVAANIKSYNELLPDYNAASAASVAASKTAADTSGAQETLQTAQNRFSTGLDTAQTDYAALDAANAATQRGIIAKRYADEAAYNDLQNQANNIAQAGVMRMTSKNGALRGGIPYGTDAQAAFARQSFEAALPYQLAKENYHQQNLANESGVETALTADEARRIGFNVSAQGQQYQSAQGTAQAIQALKVASASQDQETVKRILQNPQMLQEAVRQSMSGDTQLGMLLTQAIGANNYQALQDRLGVNVSQPQYFSQQQPGYPNAQSPVTGNNGGGAVPQYFNPNQPSASRAPTTTMGGTQDQWNYDPLEGGWTNLVTGEFQSNPNAYGASGGTTPQYASRSTGAQSNSYYDSATGTLRDRTTGQITGYAYGQPESNYNPITGADEG